MNAVRYDNIATSAFYIFLLTEFKPYNYWIDGMKETPTAPWLFSNGNSMPDEPGLWAARDSEGLDKKCVCFKRFNHRLYADRCGVKRRVICEICSVQKDMLSTKGKLLKSKDNSNLVLST